MPTSEKSASKLLLDADAFSMILTQRLPFAELMGLAVDEFQDDHVSMRAVYSERFLRPGGTIAGPIMMGLADAAIYALVLSRIGPVELAVTTQLSINFLRKPEPADVVARASMLKLGKRLAVAEAVLYSEALGIEQPVAHVTATYSIPPPDRRDS
ncbi:MAG: PaaI family thioesterase [Granulosicoccus sp.]